MIFVKNVPLGERAVRLGAGAAAIVYAIFEVGGLWKWGVVTGGAGLALTGIFGFCPACALAGRRLSKRDRQIYDHP